MKIHNSTFVGKKRRKGEGDPIQDSNMLEQSLECQKVNKSLCSRLFKKKQRLEAIPQLLFDYTADTLHAKLTHYQEPVSVAILGKRPLSLMLKAHRLTVKGEQVPKPLTSFEQLTLNPTLLKNIESLGWLSATSIQRQTVPVALAGRDLLALSPTRSGKTVGMLIPTLVHVQSMSLVHGHKRRAGPYALIITPTQTIATATEAICQRLAFGLVNTRTALLVGKEALPNQLYRLKKGAQILIATPGRLLELATDHPKLLRLWNLQMVVLDEAEALWSTHGVQMKKVMGKIKQDRNRQWMCTTATEVENPLFKNWLKRLKRPVEIKCEE
ncbi:P-loop containing nucleoside triphosphate hydrolase protein [Sporodiniella umbellata]|nr:P-loop containing nucleoside triphosphate hydrolase protein [Sporodiniella umbellata]